jgi:transcriptional regulator with XRE-family HTH domain
LRKAAELTGEDVGKQLERSDSWVSRIEAGRHPLRGADLRALLDVYGVADAEQRAELEALAQKTKGRGWWNKYKNGLNGQYATYIGFESEASSLLTYDALVMPGLLQTEAYAHALLSCGVPPVTGERSEREVKVRMARQERLNADGQPLQLHTILEEAVLHRQFGGSEVMRGQLVHVLERAKQPNVSIQVLPFTASANPGMVSSFAVIGFDEPDLDIVFVEGLTGDIFEDGADVQRYHGVYNELRSAALNKPQSVARIKEILDDLA